MKPQPVSFDTFYNSIWMKIPEVFRSADDQNGHPLQILTLTMAQQFYYYFYLKIAAMDELFDPDKCPEEYLAFLASMVGWKLVGPDPASWREQIKHAPLLYKIKGTEKSIVLAEKLIGYSVYMTELFRDYTGNIVPKERIFNNFPLSVKIKPWFRKTSIDTEKHVFSDAFSDLFPSFNENSATMNSLGELVHPKNLRRISNRVVNLSTQPGYDIKTGSSSLARLSKLPRINIILKQDKDLDIVGADGVCLNSSAKDAVDLLLQFKPFHVYINNITVMYHLTDYIFGSSLNPSGGNGDITGDAILFRESLGITGDVESTEKITYRYTSNIPVADHSMSGQDTSYNKGNVLLKYKTFSFSSLPASSYVTDALYLESLGMSLKGYNKAFQVDRSSFLWNKHLDFVLHSDYLTSSNYLPTEVPHWNTVAPYTTLDAMPAGLSLNSTTGLPTGTTSAVGTYNINVTSPLASQTLIIDVITPDGGSTFYYIWKYFPTYVDKYTRSYSPLDFVPKITTSFVSLPLDISNLTYLYDFVPLSIENSSLFTSTPLSNIYTRLKNVVSLTPAVSNVFLHDTVDITYIQETAAIDTKLPVVPAIETTKVLSESYSTGDAWSFDGLTNFRTSLPSITDLSTGLSVTTDSAIMQKLYSSGIVIAATYGGDSFFLNASDFKIDSKNKVAVFNMASIIDKIKLFDATDREEDAYFTSLLVHLLYVDLEPLAETFNNIETSITRGTNISAKRKHKKFTRFNFIDTTVIDALRNTQSNEPYYEIDPITGELVEIPEMERGFNSQLDILYSRKTLFDELPTLNSGPVLTVDSRQPRNESLWNILKPQPPSYIGNTLVTSDYFAHYYNIPIPTISSPALTVPYSSIDMSAETQILNRTSSAWTDFLSQVPATQKEYFLLSRNNSIDRVSTWTRGSALKTSLPYIGASRAFVQPFRNDLTIFNRTDYLFDYATSSISQMPTLGNYEYTTAASVDMTSIYFSTVSTTDVIKPVTNEFSYVAESLKTTISNTGLITYPLAVTNISQYDSSFYTLHRNTYYTSNVSTTPVFSLYAGNIRFDEHPESGSLFNPLSDGMDLGLSNLVKQVKSVLGTDPALPNIVLDYYNVYVTWREINTGSTVTISIAPEVSYQMVRPNIRVLHNGIETVAGIDWILSDTPGNPLTIVLLPNLVIETDDIFNVEYETFGTGIVTDPRLALQTLVHIVDETTSIVTVDYNYLKVITFTNEPVVEWLSGITPSGWSEAIDDTTNRTAPEALINRETALPNVSVSYVNSVGPVTTLLTYKTDWVFRAIPATISYRIQLLQHISDQLKPGDSVKVSYYKRP